MKQKLRSKNPLIGMFFHSINPETGYLEWQGIVAGSPEPSWYLVEVFSWIAGESCDFRLVPLANMKDWLFYQDVESMKFSYNHGSGYQKRSPDSRCHEMDQEESEDEVEG